MKEKNIHESHDRKRQSVCLSVCEWKNLNCLRVKIFEFHLMNLFFLMNICIRWINKGRKYSYQKDICLTRSYTRFSNQPTRAKTVDEKKNKIKSQSPHGRWLKISSRPLTKTKKITFFHIQFQFLSVIESKPSTLSIWKAFHNSKRQLHFLNSNQLTSN